MGPGFKSPSRLSSTPFSNSFTCSISDHESVAEFVRMDLHAEKSRSRISNRSHLANIIGIELLMGIFRVPGQVYDFVYDGYGWFGLAFAALLLILTVVGIMVWFDRRR
jgi:hypothetical protein